MTSSIRRMDIKMQNALRVHHVMRDRLFSDTVLAVYHSETTFIPRILTAAASSTATPTGRVVITLTSGKQNNTGNAMKGALVRRMF